MKDEERCGARVPRPVGLAAFGISLACVGCSAPMELPDVKTALATDLGCPVSAFGAEVEPVWLQTSDGTTLLECAEREFGDCRPGQVDYEVAVGRRGELVALSVTGNAPTAVRACVETHLREAVLTPAADCRDRTIPSTLRGDVQWGPDVGLRGSHSGILGAAWPCAPGVR